MHNETHILTAKTFSGLEDQLAQELHEMGASQVKTGRRAVTFQGDMAMVIRANLMSRLSLNILRQVNAFRFEDKDSLFAQLLETPWEDYFNVDQRISVHAVASRSELFTNTMFLAQLSKDAVVDRFRNITGRRPDVDPRNAPVRINIYVNGDQCVASLDSSGDPLFKRGYRKEGGIAPLNEILAAGLIRMSGWDKQSDLIDPMCGSGTFSIEAAMMAANMAPGIMRKAFAFMHWNDFDQEQFAQIHSEVKEQQRPLGARILASDFNIKVLDEARQNIMEAGFLGQIKVQRNDFFSFHPPATNGWVLLNPPYGQRIRQDELPAFYEKIGATLKHHYSGYYAGIISQETNRIRHIGLKPGKKFKVYNGPLECIFAVYELFQGTHKAHVASTRPKRPRL